MKRLTFKDVVLELRRRGYIADGTPKKITIEADQEKVCVNVQYNCNVPYSEMATFYREENE